MVLCDKYEAKCVSIYNKSTNDFYDESDWRDDFLNTLGIAMIFESESKKGKYYIRYYAFRTREEIFFVPGQLTTSKGDLYIDYEKCILKIDTKNSCYTFQIDDKI